MLEISCPRLSGLFGCLSAGAVLLVFRISDVPLGGGGLLGFAAVPLLQDRSHKLRGPCLCDVPRTRVTDAQVPVFFFAIIIKWQADHFARASCQMGPFEAHPSSIG